MKNQARRSVFNIIALIAVLLISVVFVSSTKRLIFFPRAQTNELTLILKLQGERFIGTTAKVNISFYSSAGKEASYGNAEFTYQNDHTFKGTLWLGSGFQLNKAYALFIKPRKYLGKTFCSETVAADQCITPMFIFHEGSNTVNLINYLFMAGDIDPADGKADSYDTSRILTDIGKSGALETDVNSDGIVDTVDYVLTLYSLALNVSDDTINFTSPTVSASPTNPASPTNTQTTSTPTPLSVGGSPTPTNTQYPTNTPVPSPTNTPYPTNTPPPTSIPTQPPQQGSCNATPPFAAGLVGCSTSSYMIPNGQTTSCSTCAGTSAKATCSCPSGTCQCNIPAQQPPVTVNCSGGGTLSIVLCN